MSGCTYVIGYVPDKGKKGKCQGCKSEFEEGDLRVGTESTTADGKKSTRWKHWGCAGARILTNIGEPENLEGLGSLKKKDADNVREDFAEHANKKGGGGGGSGGAKSGGKAKPAAKKAAPAKKKAKKEEEEEEEEEEELPEEEDEELPEGAAEEGETTGAEEEEEGEEEEEEEEEEPAPAAKGKRCRK